MRHRGSQGSRHIVRRRSPANSDRWGAGRYRLNEVRRQATTGPNYVTTVTCSVLRSCPLQLPERSVGYSSCLFFFEGFCNYYSMYCTSRCDPDLAIHWDSIMKTAHMGKREIP